jgi:ureidoglycolate lyase
MAGIILRPTALTAEAFAAFGDVMQTEGRESFWINDATCRRFNDLATIDVAEAGGRPLISVFEAIPRALPLQIRMLERHPLSSQAFFPLDAVPFLVVVAEDGLGDPAGRLRAYWSSGIQGVNYRRNTWHHPLIALHRTSRFLVVDRGGPGKNCEEVAVDSVVHVTAASEPG